MGNAENRERPKTLRLADICYFIDERVPTSDLNLDGYLSTENTFSNKNGVVRAAGLPPTAQTRVYRENDVLYYRPFDFSAAARPLASRLLNPSHFEKLKRNEFRENETRANRAKKNDVAERFAANRRERSFVGRSIQTASSRRGRKMKNIAIIPARSGSKGLPDKNIRPLDGKPLLAYSVEAALRSKLFDVVCVSTDSERYAEIGRACGAEVPFLRSAATSSDSAGSWDAVLEVLENYAKLGKTFDTVALLQPTSPLRDEDDIVGIYRFYAEKSAKGAVSVCETDHSPLWCDALPEDRSTRDFCKNRPKGPRQTLPVYYRFNGAIYVVDVEFLKKSQEITREGCYAYVMPKEKSVDVDDLFDFELAEWLSQRKKKLSR